MDPRIGPEQTYDLGCGYIYPDNHGHICGKMPTVRHILIFGRDDEGYQPCAFSCETHVSLIPQDLIEMYHPVSTYCRTPGSLWLRSINECVVDLGDLELALLGTTTLGNDIIEEFDHAKNQNYHTRRTA